MDGWARCSSPIWSGDLCADASFADFDAANLSGLVTGYAVTDTMSPRDAIAPLGIAFSFRRRGKARGLIRFVIARASERERLWRSRHRAARRRSVIRLHLRTRAGDRPAACFPHRLYRRRCRLPSGGGGGAPARRRLGSRGEFEPAAGARPGPGHRHRRAPPDGRVGRCAERREIRAGAVRAGARSDRRGSAGRGRPHAAAFASPRSTMPGARQIQAVATDPSIYESIVGARNARPARRRA